MVWGKKEQMKEEKQEFMSGFDCDDVGPLKEYVGCKVERDYEQRNIHLFQPLLL